MNIRELFGVDYLLTKVKSEPESNKLSDRITWEPTAIELTDKVLKRIREKIRDMAQERCYKGNIARINTGTIFGILQDLKMHDFYGSED